jgi:tryptophan-rich sensory protein
MNKILQKFSPNILVAIIFYSIVNIIASGFGFVEVKAFYQSMEKPWFAPAGWLFAPIWLIVTTSLTYGNLKAWKILYKVSKVTKITDEIKNIKKNLRNFFWFQFLCWLNYIAFQYLTFGTKIPAMFFWATISYFILIILSVYYSIKIDRQSSLLKTINETSTLTFTLITTVIWLGVVTPLSLYMWILN